MSVAADDVGDAAATSGLTMIVMDGGTDIKMISSADSGDYCSISTTASGATTIATVDSDDAEAAHLTFDIQGDTIFKGDIADGTSTEVARIDASANSLNMSVNSKLTFGASTNFIYANANDSFMEVNRDLEIETGRNIDIKATSYLNLLSDDNITIDAVGGIYLDADNGECRLTDDSAGSDVFTPAHAADITTKAYVDTGDNTQYHFIKCGFTNSGTAKVYIPLAGADDLREDTNPNGDTEKVVMICPFDGSVETIWARSEEDCGSTVIGMHVGTSGEIPSTTATQTVTIDMGTIDTSYEFDFAGAGTNTFSQGNILMFSFDPYSAPNDTHFMIVLKFDVST